MGTRSRGGGDPLDDEYGLDDDESLTLIELSSVGRRGASRRTGEESSSSGGGSCRCITVLFLLAMAGVYHMGLQRGKSEVIGELGTGDAVLKKSVPWREDDLGTSAPTPVPTATPDSVGSFTLERLRATREEAQKVVSMIDEYYSGKDIASRMLIDSWMDPWDFEAPDDMAEKRERAAKLVDTIARALVTDDQRTFLVGGIGSSVMAGHDNCHYDSYQTQMERLWRPVWQAAGMDFEFQNAGEGGGCGDSHENQHFCVTQNISPNVDIVHYSWTYFEGGRASWVHEDLVRWGQMLPKQPMVHVFNTGTLSKPNGEYLQLTSYYAKYGFNHFYMRTGFENGGHDYASERQRETDPFDRFGRGYVGDGYHNTTRYGELEVDETRKSSLGVVMRNWHPGPMGFQLTSDAFTYVYTNALLKALDLIEKDFVDDNDPRNKWSASERPLLMKGDLPEPQFCDPEYCVVDEAPRCLNYELPTFGQWGARVEDPNDDLNPYAGENQNWNVWHENNDIWKMVAKADIAFFKDREDKEICRHLDACGGISAQKAEDGMVVFRLPKMEVGLVVICGCCGKGVGETLFLNNENIEISYNTVPINRSSWEIWPNAKCVRVLKRFPTSGRESETPTGHHYLAVKVLNDMSITVRISHVITL
ncbi:hypothetical protein ACHAXA_006504 [Cyclostephanos tholiformis]|uniref:Uncharacterized protein n=1 Tax=Cyclostephanos tholiformis TaxID=382380 RepID=A0ABD3RZJ8_9STRA